MKRLKGSANENDGVRHRTDKREFNISKEEKLRLWVSNIYDHNAFIMLDKELDTEWIVKVYKKTNKKLEEWRALV